MPIWVKAIMKAINGHLHRANAKIRQLEKTKDEEKEVFSPHTITRLMSILGFVACRYGEKNRIRWATSSRWSSQNIHYSSFPAANL